MRILILHQILKTNLQGYVKQLEGRINNQILRVKGLSIWSQSRVRGGQPETIPSMVIDGRSRKNFCQYLGQPGEKKKRINKREFLNDYNINRHNFKTSELQTWTANASPSLSWTIFLSKAYWLDCENKRSINSKYTAFLPWDAYLTSFQRWSKDIFENNPR